jgi:hypothetical protein
MSDKWDLSADAGSGAGEAERGDSGAKVGGGQASLTDPGDAVSVDVTFSALNLTNVPKARVSELRA